MSAAAIKQKKIIANTHKLTHSLCVCVCVFLGLLLLSGSSSTCQA